MVEENESSLGIQHCFTIYGGNRALVVSANSAEEKYKWMEDLKTAIQEAKERPEDANSMMSLKGCSSEDILDRSVEESVVRGGEKVGQQRSNTTVHVCWHRNTSVSVTEINAAIKNQLSGYLLRKFKNSNG